MAEVILLCGKAGANKSNYATYIKNKMNAVILSCDELMMTLYEDRFGMKHNPVLQKSKIYLVHLAEQLVQSGTTVILDLDLWSAHERKTITQYFEDKGVETQLHYIKTVENSKAAQEVNDRVNEQTTAYTANVHTKYLVDCIVDNLFAEDFEEPDEDEIDVLFIKDKYHKA